jgi:hypothetical protein
MKRIGWIAFAHLLLVFCPGPGNARALQSSIAAPGNFTGTAVSSTSIQWSWNAVLGSSTTLGATHYELQEQTTNTVITSISGPGTTPITFLESGLVPGTTYCRHVVAFNGADSASTTDICITTQQAGFTPLKDTYTTTSGCGMSITISKVQADNVIVPLTPRQVRIDVKKVTFTDDSSECLPMRITEAFMLAFVVLKIGDKTSAGPRPVAGPEIALEVMRGKTLVPTSPEVRSFTFFFNSENAAKFAEKEAKKLGGTIVKTGYTVVIKGEDSCGCKASASNEIITDADYRTVTSVEACPLTVSANADNSTVSETATAVTFKIEAKVTDPAAECLPGELDSSGRFVVKFKIGDKLFPARFVEKAVEPAKLPEPVPSSPFTTKHTYKFDKADLAKFIEKAKKDLAKKQKVAEGDITVDSEFFEVEFSAVDLCGCEAMDTLRMTKK